MANGLNEKMLNIGVRRSENSLREIHIIPARHGIFDQAATPFFHLLCLFVHTEKSARGANGEGSGKRMRLFDFIELSGDLLSQLHVIEISQQKEGFENLPKGFQTAEFVLEHGFLDIIIPRTELKERLAQLLQFYKN